MDKSLSDFQLVSDTMRLCKSLEGVELECLDLLIEDSIEKFSGSLQIYDRSLLDHFRVAKTPMWIPMTCATIGISRSITGVILSDAETLEFLENIHLLYRLDDFVETAPERYGIQDIAVLKRKLLGCFDIFESDRSNGHSGSSLPHDSPMEESTQMSFNTLDVLQQDVLDLIDLLHQPSVKAAHFYNQNRYLTELRAMLEAMIQQLVEQAGSGEEISVEERISLRSWLHGTGAGSVGTKYQFAFFACLISARDGAACWQDAHQSYMARAFAHHVSTSWRICNDLGGRNRDREEGALTCVSLVDQKSLRHWHASLASKPNVPSLLKENSPGLEVEEG